MNNEEAYNLPKESNNIIHAARNYINLFNLDE